MTTPSEPLDRSERADALADTESPPSRGGAAVALALEGMSAGHGMAFDARMAELLREATSERYEIGSCLGRGSYGVVMEAIDRRLPAGAGTHVKVAIKYAVGMAPGGGFALLCGQPLELFAREGKALADLAQQPDARLEANVRHVAEASRSGG